MKQLNLIRIALVITICLTGCKTTPVTTQQSYIIYEYVAQVLAMPSCSATVMKQGGCYAMFKSEDGKTFYIGSPGAADDVVHFVATLEEGKTYYLPEAFMKYQRKQNKGINSDQ